jgi:hypothetical protein
MKYKIISIFSATTMMPFAWFKSISSSRILLNGQWSRYMGFHPLNGINSLYYRTQWINFDKYGRNGVSPTLGLGEYKMQSLFHLSLISSYFYANAGAVTTLLCTLIMVLSNFIWVNNSSLVNVTTVVFLMFFSTTIYGMAFARQNYQIIGLMFLPITLYFELNGYFLYSAIAWLVIGFTSITCVTFGVFVVLAISVVKESYLPILSIVPGIIISYRNIININIFELKKILKLIGAVKSDSIYKRKLKLLNKFNLYFTIIYLLPTIAIYYEFDIFAYFSLIGLIIFIINQGFIRIADEESVIGLYICLLSADVLSLNNLSPLLLISLWAAFFIPPSIFSIGDENVTVFTFTPFDHANLKKDIEDFLFPIKRGERVLFGFKDPEGEFKNIFDGYRSLMELPFLIANEKGFHAMPDWYAVTETNHPDALNFWGVEPDELIRNIKIWDVDYVVVYCKSNESLAEKYLNEFIVVGEFIWSNSLKLDRCPRLTPKGVDLPKWILLKSINILK